MKLYRTILFLAAVLTLSACGGGYEDSYTYEEQYIDWAGSVNGTIVLDATGDEFEFESITGYLHFGNTTYTNAWVDAFGNFYVDGLQIGAVYYVKSFYDETITALVSNHGYYIDIYGPESDLAWEETWTVPVYAFKNFMSSDKQPSLYTQNALESDGNISDEGAAPGANMNAFIGDLPTDNQSTLGQ
ncbi:MAG: hypothetical protein PVG20_01930 [Thioalkalispiraceae bacterium]|jgi:hypothetical protein